MTVFAIAPNPSPQAAEPAAPTAVSLFPSVCQTDFKETQTDAPTA
jgi:hypothetical protein